MNGLDSLTRADAARPRGVVLDLSRMSVDEARSLLDPGATPPGGAGR